MVRYFNVRLVNLADWFVVMEIESENAIVNSKYCVFLVIIILFHSVFNLYWILHDNWPRGCEVIDLLIKQTKFYYSTLTIHESLSNANSFTDIANCSHDFALLFNSFGDINRPNFVHLIATAGNLLFGKSVLITTFFTNSIFLSILLFSVYKIGSFLQDAKTGILAAIIVFLYPGIFSFSRKYGLDFPLTAMVSLSLCLLLKTRFFSNRKYSIIFAIIAGLCFLTKAQSAFFLFAPIVYYIYYIFFSKRACNKKEITINMLISAIIVFPISYIWIYGKIGTLIDDFIWHSKSTFNPASMVHAPFYTVESIKFYLFECWRYISPPFFVAFLFSIYLFVKNLKKRESFILLLWIIVPYIICTFIAVKWGRFYFPAFPAFAIVTAVGLMALQNIILKRVIISVILVFGGLQYIFLSCNTELYNYLLFDKIILEDDDFAHPPRQSNHASIAKDIVESFRELGFSESEILNVGIVEIYGDKGRFFGDDSSYIDFFLLQEQPAINFYRSSCGRGCDEASLFFSKTNVLDFLIIVNDETSEKPSLNSLDRCQEWGGTAECFTDEKAFLFY